jgi:hypothetical protein
MNEEDDSSSEDELEMKMYDVPNEPPSDPKEIRLMVFRPDELPSNFSMIVYGQRRTGKSNWTCWLMKTMAARYDRCVVFCSTLLDGNYQKHVNPKLCFNRFDDFTCQKLIDHQKAKMNNKKTPEKLLIIMDDVLDQTREIRQSSALNSIFTQGRHFNCSIIVLTQHVKALPPSFRKNVDACVIFRTYSHDMVKGYYEDYGGMLKRPTFFAILQGATQNHTALVLLPCCNSASLQNYMQVTRAELIPCDDDFKIGKQSNSDNRPSIEGRTRPVPLYKSPL